MKREVGICFLSPLLECVLVKDTLEMISFRFCKVIDSDPVNSRWKCTSDVHVWETVVVRRLECLRCHMGKQRNFPQSVGGNDSRVCGGMRAAMRLDYESTRGEKKNATH